MHQTPSFQKILEELTEPLLRPFPVLVLVCAIDSGFALSLQAVLGNRSRKFVDPPLLILRYLLLARLYVFSLHPPHRTYLHIIVFC